MKNEKFRLSIPMPVGFTPKQWEGKSEAIMKILREKHEIDDKDDQSCGWDLWSFLYEDDLKNIAVMVFGNDLTSTVDLVKTLVLVGNGDCPNCGSNDRKDIDGGYVRDEFGGGIEIIGHKCNSCNEEDYR